MILRHYLLWSWNKNRL